MIYTSSHLECDRNLTEFDVVAISGNRGHDYILKNGDVYNGSYYKELAPKYVFWKQWHDNLDKVSFEESTYYYIKNYYEMVLSLLDPKDVFNDLNNSILVCYERFPSFCHRYIVAEWLNIFLNENIKEIAFKVNDIITYDYPEYIKENLIKVMKK